VAKTRHLEVMTAEAKSAKGKRDGCTRPAPKRPERQKFGATRPLLPGPWPANALAFLLFVGSTLALYAGDLGLGFFNVDDPYYVVNNPWIRSASPENLRHILSVPYRSNYSPLHLLSYMLDYGLAGVSAHAFHLSSNLWAGLVAGWAFLAALALTGRRVVAFAAAALFVVHPAHVEAIAWISSRKDLVAAAFALPSLLAYLRYRQGGATAARWYAASLLLFVLAAGGKLSVATFPAVFLAFDLLVEGRPLLRSLPDKVPFLVAAGLIAIAAGSVQPPSREHADPNVLAAVFLQNVWLLTGLGNYVIYRLPPEAAAGIALRLAGAAFLLAVFAAPLLLRRRSPLATVLLYWTLLAFIPAQVLSFVHPVSDRYLFFPSAAAVILIAWGVIAAGERLGRRGRAGAAALLLGVGLVWLHATLAYLGEWRDPRSVWYGATAKSSDPEVSYNLGAQYLAEADRLGTTPRGTQLPRGEARRLAAVVWAGDARLPALLTAWARGQRSGPIERVFQNELWTLAWDAFESARRTKGSRVIPSLYFRRGMILAYRGDFPGSRREFLAALDEASRFTFAEMREEVTVETHSALGTVAWRVRDYPQALRWFRMAEEEQSRLGAKWVPDLTANRQRLEAIVSHLPSR
jgi:hypothetical protein